jgi:hypothetical protein
MTVTNLWHQWPTNFTNGITNATNQSVNGVGSFFGSYPASVVPGYGMGMVCILWVVFFSLSIASGVRKALMVSSFVTAILSTYLWRIGLIDPSIIFVFAILTIVGAIGSKEEKL